MFTTVRQIQTSDFDFSHRLAVPAVVRWMEETEYAFLRSRGLSVSLHDSLGQLGFPRLEVSVELDELDHSATAQPGDWLETALSLKPSSGKQLEYGFQLYLKRPKSNSALVTRWLTVQGVEATAGEALASTDEGDRLDYFHGIDRKILGRGWFRVACCRFPPRSLPRAILVPDWILEKLFASPE